MRRPALALAALLAAAASLAHAESSVVSSTSESISVSSAKISDSLSNSSHASSNEDGRRAEGDYTVTRMAAVEGRPDAVRLHLQPVAGGDEFDLVLPRAAAEQGRVAERSVVTADTRPYGIAFAAGTPRAPFFLALADDWARELQVTAVTL